MATIKLLLQGKAKNAPIYLRLSLDKNTSFKRKTGYHINPKDWSTATAYPKQNNPDNKNLKTDLDKLKSFIEVSLNQDTSKKIEITSNWLNEKILTHTGKNKTSDLNYLISFAEYYIDNLKTEQKVSESTIKKRITIKNKLIGYEKETKQRLKLKDVDLEFRERFMKYLTDKEKLSKGTVGKYIKEVKTFCLEAEKHGLDVSNQLKHIKGFNVKGFKVTLSFNELELLENTVFEDATLEDTRDWLIIGCYTGQRVSDLLRMNISMIETIKKYDFIVLTQVKTNRIVQIPIHPKVRQVLNKRKNQFPKAFSSNVESNKTLFNRLVKDVCEIAGIDSLTEGSIRTKEANRNVTDIYPKHKLIASHTCRRSFATNFYAQEKFPTPLLMNITGHSTEKMFLEYIGKKPIDHSLQLAEIWNK